MGSSSRPSSAPQSGRPPFRRRTFVVEGFQARFVLIHMLWLTLALGLICFVVFAPLVLGLLRSSGAPTLELADRFLTLHKLIWPLLVAFFLLAGVVSILMTHRVAGPLYRFRRVFADVGRGILTMKVRTRSGDYLQQEAAELDAMVTALRAKLRAAQAKAADAHGEALLLIDGGGGPTPDQLRALTHRIAEVREALAVFQVDAASTTQVVSPATAQPAPAANTRRRRGLRMGSRSSSCCS